MKQSYIFEYLNENEFKKKERSVRKYNMLAYKKLTFNYYPDMRSGNFLGELVSVNKKENSKNQVSNVQARGAETHSNRVFDD